MSISNNIGSRLFTAEKGWAILAKHKEVSPHSVLEKIAGFIARNETLLSPMQKLELSNFVSLLARERGLSHTEIKLIEINKKLEIFKPVFQFKYVVAQKRAEVAWKGEKVSESKSGYRLIISKKGVVHILFKVKHSQGELLGDGKSKRVKKGYRFDGNQEEWIAFSGTRYTDKTIGNKEEVEKEFNLFSSFNEERLLKVYKKLIVPTGMVGESKIIIIGELFGEGDLRKAIDKRVLSDEDRLQISRDVVKSICIFHEHGYIHRDVKPANILCKKDPKTGICRATLADAGLACSLNQKASRKIKGTLEYFPPEAFKAIKAGKEFAPSSKGDVWAAALVLFELHVGKAFDAATQQQLTASILRLSDDKEHWMLKLVKKNPGKYPNGLAFLNSELGRLVMAAARLDPQQRIASKEFNRLLS